MFHKLLFDISGVSSRYHKLWKEGMLIGAHHSDDTFTHLYMLRDFYVEVEYCESSSEIKRIHSFRTITEGVKASFL